VNQEIIINSSEKTLVEAPVRRCWFYKSHPAPILIFQGSDFWLRADIIEASPMTVEAGTASNRGLEEISDQQGSLILLPKVNGRMRGMAPSMNSGRDILEKGNTTP